MEAVRAFAVAVQRRELAGPVCHPPHTGDPPAPTFVAFLIGFVLIFAGLTFLSVLVLAPYAQALSSHLLG